MLMRHLESKGPKDARRRGGRSRGGAGCGGTRRGRGRRADTSLLDNELRALGDVAAGGVRQVSSRDIKGVEFADSVAGGTELLQLARGKRTDGCAVLWVAVLWSLSVLGQYEWGRVNLQLPLRRRRRLKDRLWRLRSG